MSNDNAGVVLKPHYNEAHRKGYLAGRRGCTGPDDPYEINNCEAQAWIMGLLDGRTRQLTVVRCE